MSSDYVAEKDSGWSRWEGGESGVIRGSNVSLPLSPSPLYYEPHRKRQEHGPTYRYKQVLRKAYNFYSHYVYIERLMKWNYERHTKLSHIFGHIFRWFSLPLWSSGRSVSIVTRLRARWPKFNSRQRQWFITTASRPPWAASYPVGTGKSFAGSKTAGAWISPHTLI